MYACCGERRRHGELERARAFVRSAGFAADRSGSPLDAVDLAACADRVATHAAVDRYAPGGAVRFRTRAVDDSEADSNRPIKCCDALHSISHCASARLSTADTRLRGNRISCGDSFQSSADRRHVDKQGNEERRSEEAKKRRSERIVHRRTRAAMSADDVRTPIRQRGSSRCRSGKEKRPETDTGSSERVAGLPNVGEKGRSRKEAWALPNGCRYRPGSDWRADRRVKCGRDARRCAARAPCRARGDQSQSR